MIGLFQFPDNSAADATQPMHPLITSHHVAWSEAATNRRICCNTEGAGGTDISITGEQGLGLISARGDIWKSGYAFAELLQTKEHIYTPAR